MKHSEGYGKVAFNLCIEVKYKLFLIMKRDKSVSKKAHFKCKQVYSIQLSQNTNDNWDSQLPEHLSPSPEKPVLQTQVNEPMVLIHLALTSQTGTEALHSSASKQEVGKNIVELLIIEKALGDAGGFH